MQSNAAKGLSHRAYEVLLDRILSGSGKPGELINERGIAVELDMSRTPVRDALLMLESEGLLVRQGKRGLQIKEMRLEDYMDALQIRAFLEPEAARLAAGHVAAAECEVLATELRALASAEGGHPERETVRGIDDRLHSMIAASAGNEQMSAIIRTLRRQTQVFDLRSVPERLEVVCEEHLQIVMALAAGDGEGAARAMREHLVHVRDSIVKRLTW